MDQQLQIEQIQYSDFPNICRFCLKSDISVPIFKQDHQPEKFYNFLDIPELILTYTSLEAKPDDGLPMFLCKFCVDKLVDCQQFRQQCITSTKHLERIKLEHKNIKAEKIEVEGNDEFSDDNIVENDDDMDMDMVPFEQIYSEIKSEAIDTKPEKSIKTKTKKSLKARKYEKEEKDEDIEKKPRKKYTRRSEEQKQAERERRKEKKEKKKEKKIPERYICQICGASVQNLNNHIQWLHMEKKYDIECDICGKKFYHYGRMKEHIRMVHIDERKYKCTICPNAFNAKYILVKHMRTHTGEKNFHCDMCDRSFGARSTLKKHRLSHTQERKFACDHCDKRFARRDGLRNHVVIHTGDRPYKCGLCPMSFKFSSTASQHRKAHVNRQPYQCIPCQMDFKSIMLYRTHMKIHKSDNIIPNAESLYQDGLTQLQTEIIPCEKLGPGGHVQSGRYDTIQPTSATKMEVIETSQQTLQYETLVTAKIEGINPTMPIGGVTTVYQ